MLDLMTQLLDRLGCARVALLMFFENVFPPLPAEAIRPPAGYLAAQGRADLGLVILPAAWGPWPAPAVRT
jgi:membrane protein DedA with SNARE-associated domain